MIGLARMAHLSGRVEEFAPGREIILVQALR